MENIMSFSGAPHLVKKSHKYTHIQQQNNIQRHAKKIIYFKLQRAIRECGIKFKKMKAEQETHFPGFISPKRKIPLLFLSLEDLNMHNPHMVGNASKH